ncbi:MAG TPA: hypothetical protein VFC00_07015 [Micromonosporaceae bacterium]|nr:hypothetical protein [Micromonosporaceae bacterium]
MDTWTDTGSGPGWEQPEGVDTCPDCLRRIGFVDLYGGGREYMCPTCGWSTVVPEEDV